MQEQAEKFVEKYGKEAAWKVDTAFSGTRSNPSHRGMIAGIGVENSLPLRYPAHPLVSIIATKFS